MQPTHIVHIIQSLGFGGAERTIVDLINHSDPERFRHSVIVFSPIVDLAAEITRPDVEVIVVQKRGKLSLTLVPRLIVALEKLQPDIVHTHIFAADVWGKIAAHFLKIPIVTTEHNVNETESGLRSMVKSWFLSYTTKYVACSERVKTYITKKYKLTKPFVVIRPGIELDRFSLSPITKFSEPIRFISVGRLTKQKGIDVALRAFAAIPELAWEYTVVGDGPLREHLLNLANKLGIIDRVTFQSATHEVPKLLENADVFVMPSRWEGLGIAAMEAMASGRLVVAANVDGIPEIIQDNKTGFLFRGEDGADLAEKIRFIFREQDTCLALAHAGHAYAEEHFGAQKMAAQYEAVYASIKSI